MEQPLRNRYHISQDEDMTYDEMTQFHRGHNKIDPSDQACLFKIEVSLNYFKGKLETVDSKMIDEDGVNGKFHYCSINSQQLKNA